MELVLHVGTITSVAAGWVIVVADGWEVSIVLSSKVGFLVAVAVAGRLLRLVGCLYEGRLVGGRRGNQASWLV